MSRTSGFLSLAVAIWLLAALLASCKNNSTSPSYGNTGGGGGGGGALELNGNLTASGGSYAHMFNTAGTFNYHCTIHGTGMAGSVIVVAGSNASAAVEISNNKYTPPSVSVMPGGTVTWTNIGVTHTVTSN